MKVSFIALLVLSFFIITPSVSAQTIVYDAQVMREVVDHYCRDTRPVPSCGIYQRDIDYAKERAEQLVAIVGSSPSGQQAMLVEGMVERVARSFYTATDPRQKLVSAWYYLYFNEKYQHLHTSEIAQLTDILYGYDERDPLFTVTQPVRYPTRPEVVAPVHKQVYKNPVTTRKPSVKQQSGGIIRSVSPLKNGTKVVGKTITVSKKGSIDLRVLTQGGKSLSRRNGYRVVATTQSTGSKVFAANYTSNGNWELRMRPAATLGDIRIYLLCQGCSGSTKFTQGSNYYGRTVVDTVRYGVGYTQGYRHRTGSNDYRMYDRYQRNSYGSYRYDPYAKRSDVRVYNQRYTNSHAYANYY